jgi:hypothetical protein
MGLLLDFLDLVLLPGPEEASPPIQQKYTAIYRNQTANLNFKIPLLFRYLRRFSSK